jgi:hypothetical protein
MTYLDNDAVDRFIERTARPMFNYRMARGALGATHTTGPMRRSASVRLRHAKKEIREAIKEYAADAMLEVT